ncbi:MAG: hypothetical protein K2Y71_13820 [Xanthobacteraceae bacterium]|nr:hypothetical protein [Xanthobacteraceae bacterium]
MTGIKAMAAAVALTTISGSAALAQSSYGVFCANGRIGIDGRSEDEMRSQRGACQFGRFPTRSDAENFARRNFKGVGSSCSCR